MDGFLNFIFHFDDWLQQLMHLNPAIALVILFSIVFTESAFFPAAPFLPGDGLLFSVGVLAAGGGLSLLYAVPALVLGGIAGTRVAYFLGVKTGNLLFMKRPERRQNQLRQAQEFYRKHGNKTFVLSRFLPVIRAIVPLVAGIAKMDKGRFWKYTVLSVSLWVVLITLVGFQLGQLPVVKRYFGVVILLVSAFSLTSVGILAIRQKMRAGNPSENTSKS